MKQEVHKDSFRVFDEFGRSWDIEHFVTLLDGREGAAFYRLADGTPVERVGRDQFDIGLVAKLRTTRR